MPERGSFWDQTFSGLHHTERKEEAGRYIIHRLNEGASLEEVCGEEYVRRHLSPEEVNEVCCYTEVVEAARKHMEEGLEPPERRR